MSTLDQSSVIDALRGVNDPELGRSLVDLNMVKEVKITGGDVAVEITLTTPACPMKTRIEGDVRAAISRIPGVTNVDVTFGAQVRTAPNTGKESLVPGVKNVVLVGSGKGGVGKSSVSVNIAVALAKEGARVGLLDADIYGPSIPIMLGVPKAKPKAVDGRRVLPVEAHGVKLMSIGFFVEPEQAMVWRGPMLHGAITQFFRDVDWGELDYLILDLPPGTGDVQLTIAQQVKVSGAVVVTTPQDLALADAIKAKSMFDKVDVPVLGIVENMSWFSCPHCEGRTEIFAHGGGAQAAEKLGVPFLGEVPLVPGIREGGDAGVPVVASSPDSAEGRALREVARRVAGQVSIANHQGSAPKIPTGTAKNLVNIKIG